MKQEMLPGFEYVPLLQNERSEGQWYYVTRNRDEEMLLTFDDEGQPVWTIHDLQNTIPHVFNTSHAAKKVKEKVGGHNVKSSPYKVIGGNRVVR